MQDQDLLSIHEAATRKGVPVGDIREGIESGALPAVEQGGAQYVRAEDLKGWEPHVKTAAGADFNLEEANDHLRTPDTPR
jgi:hypothetical protein